MWWIFQLAQDHTNNDISQSTGALTGQSVESPWLVMFFALLLLGMILLLALEEKIHANKSLITGLFAVVTLLLATAFNLLPYDQMVVAGMKLPIYIPAIDWEVIAIILGSSLFVDVTSQSGIFSWIAIKLTKVSQGDPFWLLIAYGVLTIIFSAVLNNVAAMIIIGSLTGVSLNKLNRQSLLLGFLLVEGLLTNIGGLLTLISSVPNIIIGNTASISFSHFFIIASPYVIIATVITLLMGAWLFKIKKLKTIPEKTEAKHLVSSFDENDGIPSKRYFWICAAAFTLFITALACQSLIPLLNQLGMGFIAFSFATIMLVAYKHEVSKFYRVLDWDLIFFFASLFVVINVMEHAQVLHMIGSWVKPLINSGDTAGPAALLGASALASSVTDNIPLSAMLAKILEGQSTPSDSPLWWTVVFGANLGGNITPIGSASTLVAVTIIHKYDIKLSFIKFVKLALPFAIIQILIATLYVIIRFRLL